MCAFGLLLSQYRPVSKFIIVFTDLTFALSGSCNWPVVLPLYGAGIFWTLFYDTIYAHQDKTDDLIVGVKSTALLFGSKGTKPALTVFASGMIASLVASGIISELALRM